MMRPRSPPRGVCIHLSCGLGFCAEPAAAAEMIKSGETRIESIVAVTGDRILAPCGRCREFLAQIDPRNAAALVILGEDHAVPLRELLPWHWTGGPQEESGGNDPPAPVSLA
jgi:cytidine deaminase